jgi:hypothetical protein
MAKSNKSKPIQLLSPENYIRQKARNLPIYECKVNVSWEEERMAQVLIARSHANGNITLGFYLVDLSCLGVKDSFYRFNISPDEYAELLEQFEGELPLEDISYTLAHNIIYAGLQYAEELGFKPYKDYTSITRFMLEEDTDDVELIDIEVGGKDGKPTYINSGFDTEARVKQIIAQLERSVGVGNFTYIIQAGDEDFDDDDDFEFSGLMLDELKDEFSSLINKGLDHLTEVEMVKIIKYADEIYAEICDEDVVFEYIDQWEKEFDIILTDENTNEFIGVAENVVITPKQHQLIDDILVLLGNDNRQAAKKSIELEKQIGTTSLTTFMELDLLKEDESRKYPIMLAEYIQTYPTCSLIKLLNHVETFSNKKDANLNEYLPDVDVIFEGRNSVTHFEMHRFLNEKMFLIGKRNDINLIEAFFTFLDDSPLNEDPLDSLKGLTGILRVAVLKSYFENQSA